MNRRWGAALPVLITLLLGGCGGADAEPDPRDESSNAAEASDSSSPTASADASWVDLSDGSGLGFSLPEQVEPVATTRPGADGQPFDLRLYQTEQDDVALTVTVADGQDFSNYDAGAVYQAMEQGLTETGAKDVDLTDLRPVSGGSGKGLGGTLTFQATDGSTNYWRMATLSDGSVLVNVQALTFAEELDADARRSVDDTFDQLVESLTFP